ncbi:MAG: molybdopterin-dependent oxidoreductase, partial [Candidatus Bathyarchaeia archaeon]
NNVQGACDMGALPNFYPGYQHVTNEEVRSKFEKEWGVSLDNKVGLTVMEIINAAYDGKIKGMYIMGENALMSDPNLQHTKEALEKLEFLVVQDIFMTETAQMADVVLPAASFAEKDGTFTNTGRRVQRVRRAIEPIGQSRPDWQIICQIAQKMGYPMNFSSPAEIMNEIARVTPIYGGISYDRLENGGLQWPCPDKDHPGTQYLHKDRFTRGKGRFHPVEYKPPAESTDTEYPFLLTTGRVLQHFHTGTLTRKANVLNVLVSECSVEINPKDASRLGIKDGDKIRIISRRGEIITRAKLTERSAEGLIFIPFHFWEAAANILTNDATDPEAKIPEYKVAAVKIIKIENQEKNS